MEKKDPSRHFRPRLDIMASLPRFVYDGMHMYMHVFTQPRILDSTAPRPKPSSKLCPGWFYTTHAHHDIEARLESLEQDEQLGTYGV